MSGMTTLDGETYCDDCWRGMTTVICCPTHGAATEMADLLREARAHLHSLAVPGRTLYAADCNAIEARVRDIDRALASIDEVVAARVQA